MIQAYSNKLYGVEYFGSIKQVPEWLCSLRYQGKSIARARKAILPIDPGCTGIIKLNGGEIEHYHQEKEGRE
jgi:hypothetical protein